MSSQREDDSRPPGSSSAPRNTARAVPAQNYFIYDASMRFDSYPQAPLKKQNDGQSHAVELQSVLEFNVNALGSDLPAGMMRVYQDSGALLMTAVDVLNDRYGRRALSIASAGVGGDKRGFEMKRERKTPEYTTRWSDLPTART